MGVYLHYQAMPEQSRLYRRLQAERTLCVMYAELIHRPAGPYDSARLGLDELGSYLADIAGNPVFGSREVADQVYADLQVELARAADEFPGLPDRSAYFKLQDFDESLATALAQAGCQDAESAAERLVMGAEQFAPDGLGTRDVQLRLVPSELVAQASVCLQGIEPIQLDGWDDAFAAFRRVYEEAAARGEAIVVA